ncbi:MAG TPA: glycosyltransferase family 39 protein, partial [Anaeromyxobacteraceae bacterium]|nr:glycosyltransferase family 39 protein [Anaeromyxobacteraceae bacterium]
MAVPGPDVATPRSRARRALGPALAAALVAVHAGLALHQATVQSATYDEPYYATAGWARLVAGKVGFNPEHPPAVKLWLGASWLGAAGLPSPAEIPGFAAGDQWTFGPHALYRDPARAPWLLFRARASVVLLSVLLAVGVWLAARRAFGEPAGLLALALYALDPLVVANAGLATLDLGAAAAIFAAVTLSWVALDRGGAARVAAAGVATGLALASKGTGVVVLPVLALLAVAPAA